jgi:predicted aspartyl protease
MKRVLLATTMVVMLVTGAHAGGYELQCGAPRTLIGEDANDSNPVARIAVGYSWDDHTWRVFHQLRSGAVVARQTQYGMTDASNDRRTQWQGRLLRQPWLFMVGEIKQDGAEYVYHEWMYDSKRGNALVMQAMARCTARTPNNLPTPTAKLDERATQPYAEAPAPTQQPPPQAATRSRDSVKIIVSEGSRAIHVDVLLGGMPIRMLVDTGANSSQVPQSFASMLLRSGAAIDAGTAPVRYANGQVSKEQVIRIRELRIGSHVIKDVIATVVDGPPLLGFPVFNGIAPFTIDTRIGELIWHTQS